MTSRVMGGRALKPDDRVRKSDEFNRIIKKGKRLSGASMTLFVIRDGVDVRAGFTAAKKVGNAVKRNRAKRLLREIFRQCKGRISQGCVTVAVARPELLHNTFQRNMMEFLSLLGNGGFLKEESA